MDPDETALMVHRLVAFDEKIHFQFFSKFIFSSFLNSFSIFISVLNLVLLNPDISSSENSVDPDQLLVGVSNVKGENLNVLIIFGRRNVITLIDTLENILV